MIRLKDPSTLTDLASPPGGIELPPLLEPESLEITPPYVRSAAATLMTSEELAEAGSAATPPAPQPDLFGDRVSHITDRFVLSGSKRGIPDLEIPVGGAPDPIPGHR